MSTIEIIGLLGWLVAIYYFVKCRIAHAALFIAAKCALKKKLEDSNVSVEDFNAVLNEWQAEFHRECRKYFGLKN